MNSKPIIRWAGSKRKLLPKLLSRIPSNIETYVEPFCGSASLFFELQPAKAILNDINPELINAYAILKNSVDFYDRLIALPISKEQYYYLRELRIEELTEEERAIRFFYINRYCFNGVYRTNKNGHFNVPYGTRTGGFPEKKVFRDAMQQLQIAELIVGDYYSVLEKIHYNDFVYLDPPYSKSSQFSGEYGSNSFKQKDLPNLISFLSYLDTIGAKFLFSYYADQDLLSSFKGCYLTEEVLVRRHISGFKKQWDTEFEILVRNYE